MLATYPHSWVCYFVNFAHIKSESRLPFKFCVWFAWLRFNQMSVHRVGPYFNVCKWFSELSVASVQFFTFGCKRNKRSDTHKAYLVQVLQLLESWYRVLHLILQTNLHHSPLANMFITHCTHFLSSLYFSMDSYNCLCILDWTPI